MFSAHADAHGTGGTAILLSSDITVVTSGKASYGFDFTGAVVVHACPRLLLVAISAGSVDFMFCSAHVPDTHRTKQRDWLREQAPIIRAAAAGRLLVIAIDANITYVPAWEAAGEAARRPAKRRGRRRERTLDAMHRPSV